MLTYRIASEKSTSLDRSRMSDVRMDSYANENIPLRPRDSLGLILQQVQVADFNPRRFSHSHTLARVQAITQGKPRNTPDSLNNKKGTREDCEIDISALNRPPFFVSTSLAHKSPWPIRYHLSILLCLFSSSGQGTDS